MSRQTKALSNFYWGCWLALGLAQCVPEARLHQDSQGSGPPVGGASRNPDGGAGDEGAVISIPGTAGKSSVGDKVSGDAGRPDTAAGTPASGGTNTGGTDSGGSGPQDDGVTGHWTGLTSQGRLFTFDVYGGAVIRIGVDWEVDVPVGDKLCVANGEVATQLGMPAKIDSHGRFMLGPLSGPPVTYTAQGTVQNGSASGAISISHPTPGCDGDAQLTWTAERVTCGDGHLTWPETCDPQDPLRSKGCDPTTCQLSPVPEDEPNNAPNPTAAKIEDDALLSGSLTANDVDVFAIHNKLAGTVALEFESFTETVGTCHVNDKLGDTLIEVLNESGDVLAQDDDGSRIWFCSHLARQISAGQTLYVRISSLTGPVPTYILHVKFQKS